MGHNGHDGNGKASMRELVLICALALPSSGSSWFGSERGAVGPDPHVQVYKMLIQHIAMNIDGPRRSLVIGNSPREVWQLGQAGLESFGLAVNGSIKGFIRGLDSAMPVRQKTMALVLLVKGEPNDAWLAMRTFRQIVDLIQPWGFFIIPNHAEKYLEWLPRYGFFQLPFRFHDASIWQRNPHGRDDHGQPKNGSYRHLEIRA